MRRIHVVFTFVVLGLLLITGQEVALAQVDEAARHHKLGLVPRGRTSPMRQASSARHRELGQTAAVSTN